jgi:hypothetical protein
VCGELGLQYHRIDAGNEFGVTKTPEYRVLNPVAHYQTVEPILTGPAAFFTLNSKHGELADQVTEFDRAVARPIHPSTRNANSIWAVAASTSLLFPVFAALRSSSTAKSQYGRACRHGFICPMKRAASSNVANSAPVPPVGSITRVSASLKS